MEIVVEKRKRRKMTRLSKDEFLEMSKKMHGDKYDYSKVVYKNQSSKVKIICSIHGEFEQIPNKHIHQDCPKCAFKNISEKKIKWTNLLKKQMLNIILNMIIVYYQTFLKDQKF